MSFLLVIKRAFGDCFNDLLIFWVLIYFPGVVDLREKLGSDCNAKYFLFKLFAIIRSVSLFNCYKYHDDDTRCIPLFTRVLTGIPVIKRYATCVNNDQDMGVSAKLVQGRFNDVSLQANICRNEHWQLSQIIVKTKFDSLQ